MLMLVIKLVSGALPKASPVETPWEDLKSALSSPNILVPRDYTSWKKQCYDPFIKVAVPAIQMLNQPTGLCMMHASCAFQDCFGPPKYDSSSTTKVQGVGFISTLLGLKKFEEDRFNLPAVVLHPHSVSDIVQAVLFSKEHDIGVTVKVGGHSYYGASTARDTLLIKMSTNYPSYAMEGSLTECANRHGNEYSGVSMACKLAAARGKNAVIRVGGGEIWGKAYRAVSVEWNRNNPNKYHLVGGGSMTVSSAGGWFHSGGLAGPNGMRMFGFGVDQALHIEMVLPSGTHVRFGPSEWQHVDGYIYPKTTKVIGFCNVNPFQQEANWNWSTCAENINFDDLWFAVRGGGGGTYGILTSLYYQLHDYPGELQRVYAEMKSLSLFTWTRNSRLVFTKTFIEFLLRFLYRPLDFNVSQLESNRCGEGFSLGLNPFIPFVNPRISCYGSSAATLINSWRSFVTSPAVIATFRQAGMTNRQIETVPALFVLGEKADSFYDMEALHPTSPNDKALPIPALPSAPEMTDSRMTHFPYSTVVDKT